MTTGDFLVTSRVLVVIPSPPLSGFLPGPKGKYEVEQAGSGEIITGRGVGASPYNVIVSLIMIVAITVSVVCSIFLVTVLLIEHSVDVVNACNAARLFKVGSATGWKGTATETFPLT